MIVNFPLPDVNIKETDEIHPVKMPLISTDNLQLNQNEFYMQIDGVGKFYACNGKEIEFSPEPDASQSSVELYLNGSVYGAILHQRMILPLHGSSFVWKEHGILLCGESGAGKSSLTAGFCYSGAEFLTDDVTPIKMESQKPVIIPLSDRIKLWNDSLIQMDQKPCELVAIHPGHDKYYLPIKNVLHNKFPLHFIFLIEVSEYENIEFIPLTGVQKFTALRNEIYRWEYLSAMPATEQEYIKILIELASSVEIVKIHRPKTIPIMEMIKHLKSNIYHLIVNSDEIIHEVF